MRVDLTYTYHCDLAGCDVTETQHVEDVVASLVPPPHAPRGWVEIGRYLFCPRHVFLLQIDGQTQPLESL